MWRMMRMVLYLQFVFNKDRVDALIHKQNYERSDITLKELYLYRDFIK